MSTKRLSQGSEEVIKRGCLIKSPPSSFIKGWKRREFKLCRSPDETYSLNYYSWDGATETRRGSINISEIQSITKGSASKEDLAATLKACRCSPENVLVVRTDKRTYFLADEDPNEIEDWYNHLTESVERIQSNNKRFIFPSPSSSISRPYTGPYSPHWDRTPINVFAYDFNQPSLMDNRIRPKSYPQSTYRSHGPIIDLKRWDPQADSSPSSEPFHLYEDIPPQLPPLPPKQKRGTVSDAAPSEPINQNTPPLPKVTQQMSNESSGFTDLSDTECDVSYMEMYSVIEKCKREIKQERDMECTDSREEANIPQGGQLIQTGTSPIK
ncbi:hypothetical protein XENTR_v10017548 [Xenopus tropicalis]|nr:hypothetical protein XENTR_v10017548 [Xenopus tropicalis]|eukprot:XP_017945885.1 PREDICTED: uncharacterized protein LOC101733565 [Xenopus tropicalis]